MVNYKYYDKNWTQKMMSSSDYDTLNVILKINYMFFKYLQGHRERLDS